MAILRQSAQTAGGWSARRMEAQAAMCFEGSDSICGCCCDLRQLGSARMQFCLATLFSLRIDGCVQMSPDMQARNFSLDVKICFLFAWLAINTPALVETKILQKPKIEKGHSRSFKIEFQALHQQNDNQPTKPTKPTKKGQQEGVIKLSRKKKKNTTETLCQTSMACVCLHIVVNLAVFWLPPAKNWQRKWMRTDWIQKLPLCMLWIKETLTDHKRSKMMVSALWRSSPEKQFPPGNMLFFSLSSWLSATLPCQKSSNDTTVTEPSIHKPKTKPTKPKPVPANKYEPKTNQTNPT